MAPTWNGVLTMNIVLPLYLQRDHDRPPPSFTELRQRFERLLCAPSMACTSGWLATIADENAAALAPNGGPPVIPSERFNGNLLTGHDCRYGLTVERVVAKVLDALSELPRHEPHARSLIRWVLRTQSFR